MLGQTETGLTCFNFGRTIGWRQKRCVLVERARACQVFRWHVSAWIAIIPEPSTAMQLALGLLGLGLKNRRRC